MFLDDATERALDERSLREAIAEEDGLGPKLKAALLWLQSTRLMRANSRFGTAQGNLLAGGIAYTALISISAALVIGWTVFMAILGGNDELRNSVLDSINGMVPGLIGEGKDYVISPSSLVLDSAINIVSIVTTAALIWSATALMGALRMSIRQVFGIAAIPESFVLMKLRDLAGFVVLALSVLVTSASGIAVNTVGHLVFDFLNIEGTGARIGLYLATIGVSLLIDLLIFVMVIRLIAGARPPRKDLLLGALIGAIGSGVIRWAGTTVVSVPDNPLFSSIAAVGTLLIVVNLMARLVLYVAAFVSNPPAPVKPKDAAEVHFHECPNYVTVSAPETLEWDHQPATGSVIPDPSLNPDNPQHEPEAEPTPRWGGLIGAYQRRRIDRIERKLDRARGSYYR